MADLDREEIEELRRGCQLYLETLKSGQPWGPEIVSSFDRMGGEHQVILRLLDMASRCVSEETLLKLALAQSLADDVAGDAKKTELAYMEFNCAAQDELETAAESLARKNGGERG